MIDPRNKSGDRAVLGRLATMELSKKSSVTTRRLLMKAKQKNATPRRRIGRPQISGDTVGRDVLLAATKELLKQVPPAKITRVKVARFAGVTPALVRYYFGNTKKLLRATTIMLSQEQRARSRARVAAAKGAKQKLLGRIEVLTETLVANPHFNQLIFEQVIRGEGEVAKHALEQMNKDSLSELRAILNEGVRRRELRPVDVKFLYCALIGMSEFFASSGPSLESLGVGDLDNKLMKRYVAFIHDLVINGIAMKQV